MGQQAILLAVLILLVILLIFVPAISEYVRGKVGYPRKTPPAAQPLPDAADAPAPAKVVVTGATAKEHMTNSPGDIPLPAQTSDMLLAMGYTGTVPWDEVIQATELDPSTFASQQEFVKDVRRFSSGANFTSVNDDNTNSAFTNFIGLQRPQHVPIGSTARQIPDVDENVLQRNHQLRFN